ncbi:putative RiPP precursor [Mesorhizobium sp. 131-2-1]|nr:putative RiPP precursor [Mesorhizobium sp. 131-2-1]
MTRKTYEAPVLRKAGRLSGITAANGNSLVTI